jgi:hypothetical protein
METLIIHRLPLDAPDVEAIVDLLRGRDVFTPSFIKAGTDIYNPLTYVQQRVGSGTKTILLADRNVFTRWLALMNGAVAEPEHRVVAAVMAFAQCAGILIEPSLALYEAAATAGSNVANEELRQFRIADNLEPICWADVALARASKLSLTQQATPPSLEPVDFEMPLRRWRRNYVIALKVAELALRGGKAESQMTELLRWMYQDFLIGGPAAILAAHYLAPNSDRKGLLKNVRSSNRERAVLGVRNAAWDLTLLSDWIVRVQEQVQRNELSLLCSLDRKVVEFARLLTDEPPEEPTADSPLLIIFESLWGTTVGRRLSTLAESYLSDASNTVRQLHRPEEVGYYVDRLIREGEAFIRNWKG